MTSEPHNVVIIGSGPAGLTAAIYTARANLRPVVIAGSLPGGQLQLTTEVENYPGFPEGILGPDLMARFRQQAERFGARVIDQECSRVDFGSRPLRVWAGDDEYAARAVIIATGASARMLGLENEKRLLGHGVSTCATCDGFFFRGQEIAVVGGGDAAIEEATFLTKFATKVTVIHRRDQLRASKIMQDRAFRNEKVTFLWDSVVTDVLDGGTGRVTAVRVANVKTKDEKDIPLSGVFIAIGHVPNTAVFAGQVDLDPQGYIVVRNGTRTSVEGVFTCGDVQDHVYRQAVTASGSGCMAAIDLERYLEAQGG